MGNDPGERIVQSEVECRIRITPGMMEKWMNSIDEEGKKK